MKSLFASMHITSPSLMTENCGIRVKLVKVTMTVSEQTTNKCIKVVAWILYYSEMKIVCCRFSFINCLFQGNIGATGEDGKTGRDGSNVITLLRLCYCNHTSVFFELTSQKYDIYGSHVYIFVATQI